MRLHAILLATVLACACGAPADLSPARDVPDAGTPAVRVSP